MKKTTVLLLSFIFLFAFVLLSKYEDREKLRNFDLVVIVKVQDYIARLCRTRCDSLFEDIGFLASPTFSLVGITIITLVTFAKTKGRRKMLALTIPLAFALLTFAEIYGKSMVRHPGPPFFFLKNPSTNFPTYYVWQEFSYPSGHAARAVFLGTVFYLSFSIGHLSLRRIQRKLVAVGAVGYVLIVSLSRIYLGHHWWSDVVGGWLLGGGLGVLTWAVVTQYNKKAMS